MQSEKRTEERTMSLRGFATLNFWADDVAGAVAWYTEFLGVEPLFTRPGADGRLSYAKYRVGEEAELAIGDRAYAPPGTAVEPGGAVMHWLVDDLEATRERLMAMGAREYEPPTPHGPVVTASVVDPFGNLFGLVHNPHMLASRFH